jgi:Bacterial DNA-binding protein
MQKNSLIQLVARKLSIEPTEVKKIVNTTLSEIVENCRAGGECNLLGFGKFLPRLAQPYDVDLGHRPRYRFEFRPSGTAERRLNEGLTKAVKLAQAEAKARRSRKSRKARKRSR